MLIMISKRKLFFPAAASAAICMMLLQCMQNPADVTWKSSGGSRTVNRYREISSLAQKSDGAYYGASYNAVCRFDETDLRGYAPLEIVDSLRAIQSIGIDKNDDIVVVSEYDGMNILRHTAAGWQAIVIDSADDIRSFSNPQVDGGEVFWTASRYRNGATERFVRKWDGNAVSTIGRIPVNALVRGVVPGEGRSNIFTLEYSDSGIMTCSHLRFEGGEETYRAAIKTDSCAFSHVFGLQGRIFALGYSYRRDWKNNVGFFVGEILDNDTFIVRDTIISSPDCILLAGNAFYFSSSTTIYKVTQDGVRMLSIESDYYQRGVLFLDCDKHPALFFPAARRIFRVDSLPGYVELARW
jgi:hypothetical protein